MDIIIIYQADRVNILYYMHIWKTFNAKLIYIYTLPLLKIKLHINNHYSSENGDNRWCAREYRMRS